MQEFARDLLMQDGILLGYELEDGELGRSETGKELVQFLVRPITKKNFIDLWEHGRKYCSKFTIYLVHGEIFCERRPDMKNYVRTGDEMCIGDILVGAKRIMGEIAEHDCGHDYVERNIGRMNSRIEEAIENVVDIVDLGGGRYNIIFEY